MSFYSWFRYDNQLILEAARALFFVLVLEYASCWLPVCLYILILMSMVSHWSEIDFLGIFTSGST